MDTSAPAAETAALQYLQCGEAQQAIAALQHAVARTPGHGRLWQLLGIAQWEIGAVEASVASLETAMTLVPLRPEASLALALGYEVQQKHESSSGLLVALTQQDGLPTQLMEPLARALGRARKPELAYSVCRRASRAQPGEVAPLVGMVFYMRQTAASDEAVLPLLLRALGLAPEDFGVRMLAAQCLHQCGLSDDAAQVLRAADYVSSGCPTCLAAMQEIFAEAGDALAVERVGDRLAAIEAAEANG